MNDFEDYFRVLRGHEGLPAARLVSRWRRADIEEITRDFGLALTRCPIDRQGLPVHGAPIIRPWVIWWRRGS